MRQVEVEPRPGPAARQAARQLLAGVPRSRIFRVIRRARCASTAGGRAPSSACSRAIGCVCRPVREGAPEEPAAGASGADRGRRARHYLRGRAAAGARQARRGRGARRQWPDLWRHRGAAGLRPEESLELVHRLDRDTSGCLLVARRSSALRTLHALLREGAVQKSYLALLAGRGTSGTSASMRRCAPTRASAASAPCAWSAAARRRCTEFKPVQLFGKHGVAGRSRPAYRPHASDPRARRARRPPGRGRSRSMATRPSTRAARAGPAAHVPARPQPRFPMARGRGAELQRAAASRAAGGARPAAEGRGARATRRAGLLGQLVAELRSARANAINGNPIRAVGSSLTTRAEQADAQRFGREIRRRSRTAAPRRCSARSQRR